MIEIAALRPPVAAAPSTNPDITRNPCEVIQNMSAEGSSHFEKPQWREQTSRKTAVFHPGRPKRKAPCTAEPAHAAATIQIPATAVGAAQAKGSANVAAIWVAKRST